MKRFALILAFLTCAGAPLTAQQGPRIAHQPSARTPFSAAIQVDNTYRLSGKLGATAGTHGTSKAGMHPPASPWPWPGS